LPTQASPMRSEVIAGTVPKALTLIADTVAGAPIVCGSLDRMRPRA
jgi:hypothetical protein